jgi:sortase A
MKWIRLLGKFLISVGVGVLLFVAWTLWGTGIYYDHQQDRLSDRWDALPLIPDDPTDDKPPGPPAGFSPKPGEGVFRLLIPKIGRNDLVVEGVGIEALRTGPGHYPSCRAGFDRPLCTDSDEIWPGQDGRVIVSGHRTTYGHPFYDLNELERGDKIITDTKWGKFTYLVSDIRLVEPDDPTVVRFSDDAEIVLTTCNPRYSADQRLVVIAEMEQTL